MVIFLTTHENLVHDAIKQQFAKAAALVEDDGADGRIGGEIRTVVPDPQHGFRWLESWIKP